MNEKAIHPGALELNINLVRIGKHPERSIKDLKLKTEKAIKILRQDYPEYLSSDFRFKDHYYKLPAACFRPFSKEDKIRLKFASFIVMHPTFGNHLEQIREFEIIDKLANSQWRYGFGEDWNTLVRAYNGLRKFEFGDDFEVRIDMTTGYNECGFSRYERVYLDGVFGFIIYYKGKHVLTIGFSFADKNRVLIQQVQMKNKKGNRFLYKLPAHILDYAIEKMHKAFGDMNLYLCQADDQIKKIHKSYNYRKEEGHKFLENDAPRLKKFYSRRLRKFHRRPSQTQFHGVRFRKLVEKVV